MKTKTLLIISLAAIVPIMETIAQENGRKHEISIGAGIWSTGNLAFTLSDAFINAIDIAGDVQLENRSASPVYHVSYKHFPNRKLAIGVTLAAGTEKATGRDENQHNGKLKRSYANIAIEPAYYYLNREKFKLYGLVGVGLLYLYQNYTPNNGKEKDQSLYAADFQVTPIGIKVGNAIGGYLEAGIGYKGIISCGFFCRF
ncbi:MAG: hypothetical protein LBS01_00420 [Prevotellaceae bacterium]|jgi:hypothetical protein|nr:hypothetical protein [Prevotellaceae bacterium]